MSTQDAQENGLRYQYARDRGHLAYMALAKLCENMYLGGGRQWSPEDRKILDAQKRPAYEFNEIMPAINAAIGTKVAITYEQHKGLPTTCFGETEYFAVAVKPVAP